MCKIIFIMIVLINDVGSASNINECSDSYSIVFRRWRCAVGGARIVKNNYAHLLTTKHHKWNRNMEEKYCFERKKSYCWQFCTFTRLYYINWYLKTKQIKSISDYFSLKCTAISVKCTHLICLQLASYEYIRKKQLIMITVFRFHYSLFPKYQKK